MALFFQVQYCWGKRERLFPNVAYLVLLLVLPGADIVDTMYTSLSAVTQETKQRRTCKPLISRGVKRDQSASNSVCNIR
jgi:hypothetical protein